MLKHEKSQNFHSRSNLAIRTNYNVGIVEKAIDDTKQYTYLSLLLSEYKDFIL